MQTDHPADVIQANETVVTVWRRKKIRTLENDARRQHNCLHQKTKNKIEVGVLLQNFSATKKNIKSPRCLSFSILIPFKMK